MSTAIFAGIGFLTIGIMVLVWWLSQALVQSFRGEYRAGIAALVTGVACIGVMALTSS